MSRLKELRKYLNLSQAELSSRIRLNQSYYSQVERGQAKLNDRIIKLVCDEFNVCEDWLRGSETDMFQAPQPEGKESVGFAIFKTLSPEKQEFALSVLRNLREMQDREENEKKSAAPSPDA